MRYLLSFVIFTFSCLDLYSMSYRNALRIPDATMAFIHSRAISVNDKHTLNLSASGRKVGEYLERNDSVICSFLSDVIIDFDTGDVASLITRSFSEKEIILTGYHAGANYASKIASILSRSSNFENNQIKLIIFCAREKFSEDLDSLYLTCKLHFSHAFTKPDFYGSSVIEIPISKLSEIRSRITLKDVFANLIGIGLIGFGIFSGYSNEVSVISSLSGVGIVGIDICSITLKPQQYLPTYGVVDAYKRASSKAWSAEFESEFRTIGK